MSQSFPTFVAVKLKEIGLMNAVDILSKYYSSESEAYHIVYTHSRSVADKALSIAALHPEMNIDLTFIEEASLLHDVGVSLCHAPDIHCYGNYPYICHGYLGADLMLNEGFPQHALVCERHTGAGLSLADIRNQHLPVPHRNMLPESLEEKLICFADKFYSKTKLDQEKSMDKIRKGLSKYGDETVLRFEQLCKLFLG